MSNAASADADLSAAAAPEPSSSNVATAAPVMAEADTDSRLYVTVSRSRSAGEFRLCYELHGSGPKRLLLIMGLNAAKTSWVHQVKHFSSLPEYSVCIFDNRGVGFSDAPHGRYKTSEMAEDAYELLKHIGWNDHVNVVGISMGGMIAQELTYAHIDMFDTLTLISTHAGQWIAPIQGTIGTLRIAQKPVEERIKLAPDLLYSKEWLDAKCKHDGFETNRHFVVHYMREGAKRSRPQQPQGAKGQIAAAITHSFSRQRLHTLRDSHLNIRVITGTYDNFVWPSNSHYLAKELNAPLSVMEGAGHAVISERTEEVHEIIHKLIESGPKPRKADNTI